jgi:hypothetical protein
MACDTLKIILRNRRRLLPSPKWMTRRVFGRSSLWGHLRGQLTIDLWRRTLKFWYEIAVCADRRRYRRERLVQLYAVVGGQLLALQCISCCPFPTACLDLLMTVHTKYALRSSRIAKVLNLFLAIATFEAIRAEGLISSQYGQVLDLVSTAAAAVCAVVAY